MPHRIFLFQGFSIKWKVIFQPGISILINYKSLAKRSLFYNYICDPMAQKKLQRFADIKTFSNVLEYPRVI